ncbi:hypothetical protein MBLNU13_g08816t1 [Cladosporium sp. NU13]
MAPCAVYNNFHTTVSMENMHHRTITLTCTDNADDIPLNPDGTFPTPAQKALDILTNTTTKAVVNLDTNAWELLTTRHSPFGMPLSEQHGENWWMAVDTSAAEEEERVERAMADLALRQEALVDRMIEESMAEVEVRMETLRQAVAMELQAHDDDEEVSEWIPRRGDQPGRWRRTTRRQVRDSGVYFDSPNGF